MVAMAEGRLGRPVEVLLIEDNHGDVVLTREAFRTASVAHSISVASDGEEAMRMLRREGPHTHRALPDVILLDLNLPRKHGREVMEEISRNSLISNIPVVVMIGANLPSNGEGLNADCYVTKPVDAEGVEKIVALIGRERVTPGEHACGAATPEAALDGVEKELADFAYITAHDLGAAFRHVAAFSRLLVRELGPDASPQHLARCEQIQQSTEKCQLMLAQVSAFSQAQRAVLDPVRCDATRLMEVAMLQLSADVQRTGAKITIGALGEAVMDATLMTQVFKHALDNAIKFRRPGIAPEVEVRAVESESCWVVHISDNGVGVALERQERMFAMFCQEQAETAFAGVGAGLAIARRILRRHGGDARFIEVAQGACLEITLPASAAA